MRRREFVTLLGGAAVAWPFAALAQQPVIGFLSARSPGESASLVAAFHKGLNETGYVEGRNVAIEYRWAEGKYDVLPIMATDLIRRQVTVIVAIGDPSPQIAKAATQTIPIVFAANGDPVRDNLVASLNRPGGNATGVTIFGAAAVTKRLQAQSLGLQMHVLSASNEGELEVAFATMAQHRAGALLVASDLFFLGRRDQLVSLAARHQIPAIYYLREFAEAGGLMSYGNRLPEVYRLVGVYVGRVLKGEKPADLPVMQSTKFEFVLNLKTAKALGIEVPISMQLLVDEVIE